MWAAIPKELADRVRPMAPVVVAEMIGEIQRCVPEYAQPLEGTFGQVLIGSVERAVLQGFENVANPDVPRDEWEAWFRRAGRLEYCEGRTMDSLQRAVRVGARVCWRRLSAEGQAMGVSAEVLLSLADAIFAYVDEICAVAIAGYAEAQVHAAGALERRRQRLMRLLLSDPPASRDALGELASAAAWPLPERVAVVALEPRPQDHTRSPVSLSHRILVDLESSEPCLVVPDPQRHLPRLAEDLAERAAAVGPTVELSQAPASLGIARRALRLARRGVLPAADRVVWCTDHLTELILLGDEHLLAAQARHVLAPFSGLTDKQRERLSGTLLAWLQTRGGVNEIAARLAVHPQTVRYRVRQLERLLGDRLTDPDQRLAMEMALRGRQLLAAC